MPPVTVPDSAGRLLVVIPNWVGDVVLASPTLAALRAHFHHGHISFLLRRYVAEIVAGCGWHDELIEWPALRGVRGTLLLRPLVRRLRQQRYDLTLVLTNSFRSALVVWLAGVPRRVGYAREARGCLLTDPLRPLKRHGEFVPASVLPYYAALAEHIGCPVTDRRLRLGLTPEQERAGAALTRHYGLDDGQPYAVVNPGARFGASKCWLPERFAEVCERLWTDWKLLPVLVGSPDETPLLREIAQHVSGRAVCCDDPGTTLGSLKPLVRGASLLVCNDTGPRHYGIALNVPTITLFGPTHQEWTDTGFADEIRLQAAVECGPCQLPRCPLDHCCMTELTTDTVVQAIAELLRRRPPGQRSPSGAGDDAATGPKKS